MRRVLALSLLAITLTGCGGGAGYLLDFRKDVVITGKREPVLGTEGTDEVTKPAEPLVVPPQQANASWAQPGGNPSHSLQHVALAAAPKKLFSSDAGEGSDSNGRLTAPPIVDGGRAFVIDTEATVSAFDANSGKRLWRVSLVPEKEETEGAYGGGLASDGQRIYAVTAFGEAIALSPADGKPIWRKKLDSPVRAAPTVDAGRLYFVAVNNDVIALNAADGAQVWVYQGTGEQAAALTSTSPAVAGDLLVAPTTSGDLVAISASSGAPLWQAPLTALDTSTGLANLNDIAARPVIENGNVFALSHTGRFAGFAGQNGERLWERSLSGTETPWAAGGVLYVISGRTLQAVSAKSGGSYWSVELPKGTWAGPVLAGGRLIAVSTGGEMASFDPQTGKLLGSDDLGGRFYIAPVVANGTAYLLSDSAELIALR